MNVVFYSLVILFEQPALYEGGISDHLIFTAHFLQTYPLLVHAIKQKGVDYVKRFTVLRQYIIQYIHLLAYNVLHHYFQISTTSLKQYFVKGYVQ